MFSRSDTKDQTIITFRIDNRQEGVISGVIIDARDQYVPNNWRKLINRSIKVSLELPDYRAACTLHEQIAAIGMCSDFSLGIWDPSTRDEILYMVSIMATLHTWEQLEKLYDLLAYQINREIVDSMRYLISYNHMVISYTQKRFTDKLQFERNQIKLRIEEEKSRIEEKKLQFEEEKSRIEEKKLQFEENGFELLFNKLFSMTESRLHAKSLDYQFEASIAINTQIYMLICLGMLAKDYGSYRLTQQALYRAKALCIKHEDNTYKIFIDKLIVNIAEKVRVSQAICKTNTQIQSINYEIERLKEDIMQQELELQLTNLANLKERSEQLQENSQEIDDYYTTLETNFSALPIPAQNPVLSTTVRSTINLLLSSKYHTTNVTNVTNITNVYHNSPSHAIGSSPKLYY